jgi:hypothetical protein
MGEAFHVHDVTHFLHYLFHVFHGRVFHDFLVDFIAVFA